MEKPLNDTPPTIFGDPKRMNSPLRGESEKIRELFLRESVIEDVPLRGEHPFPLNDRDTAAALGVSKTLVTKMRTRLGVPHVKDRRIIVLAEICSMVQKKHFEVKALQRKLFTATRTALFLALLLSVSIILNLILL